MDVIARPAGCAGQAADAPKSKVEATPSLLKIQKSQSIQILGYVYQNTNGPNRSKEDPVVFLERNLHGHPLARLLWEGQFEKVPLEHGWVKVPNWKCLFVNREKGQFLSVHVDDLKIGRERNRTLIQCGKYS